MGQLKNHLNTHRPLTMSISSSLTPICSIGHEYPMSAISYQISSPFLKRDFNFTALFGFLQKDWLLIDNSKKTLKGVITCHGERKFWKQGFDMANGCGLKILSLDPGSGGGCSGGGWIWGRREVTLVKRRNTVGTFTSRPKLGPGHGAKRGRTSCAVPNDALQGSRWGAFPGLRICAGLTKHLCQNWWKSKSTTIDLLKPTTTSSKITPGRIRIVGADGVGVVGPVKTRILRIAYGLLDFAVLRKMREGWSSSFFLSGVCPNFLECVKLNREKFWFTIFRDITAL